MINYDISETEYGKIFLYTRRGSNHVAAGLENQDSLGVFTNKGKGIAFVAADGVSSCSNSKQGSEFAVTVVSELLDAIVCKEINIENEDAIKKFIVQSWKSRISGNWNNYATTLNFAIVISNKVLLGKIGDGTIIAKLEGNNYLLRDEDSFYTTETYALGEAVLKASILLEVIKIDNLDNSGIILMTDGIAKEIEPGSEYDFLDYIRQLGKSNEKQVEIELKAWAQVLDTKNGDDKSIVIGILEDYTDE
ncbi:hypothetical protein JT05_00770 [Desulfosporosinus sp. Tol-M]|nr:hypothetical protein JT05_00770 [Desulfosporosinus sp. Tol-M]